MSCRMEPSDLTTAAVSRSYFDGLLRGAKSNADPVDLPNYADSDMILVSQDEYERLLKIASSYANLTRNLVRGGVEDETITLLSQDDSAHAHHKKRTMAPSTIAPSEDGGARLSSVSTPTSHNDRAPDSYSSHSSHNHASFRRNESGGDWADQDPVSDDISFDTETPAETLVSNNANQATGCVSQRPHFERHAHRTLILSNLAEGVTHLDITQAVRGGMLLDVYMRSHDRTCSISFLNASDAKIYYDNVRRHDLYIKNKRVEIRWSDRHFVLPGHIANKIGIGATRNLVLRRCDPRHTEESIREDLAHIHNLVVIKVEFEGTNCRISTNSVHNAMFARTCMMSRLKYKGSKIDWDSDECAQPLERVQAHRPRKEAPQPARKALNPMTNRFHLLNLEEDDDEKMSHLAASPSVDIAA